MVSSIHNTKSILTESHITSLQREVDNYTRKLEQEKRRLFAIEETYSIVSKEYREHKCKLLELQKVQNTTETKLLQAKVKNMENELEQAVSK